MPRCKQCGGKTIPSHKVCAHCTNDVVEGLKEMSKDALIKLLQAERKEVARLTTQLETMSGELVRSKLRNEGRL